MSKKVDRQKSVLRTLWDRRRVAGIKEAEIRVSSLVG